MYGAIKSVEDADQIRFVKHEAEKSAAAAAAEQSSAMAQGQSGPSKNLMAAFDAAR